VCCSVSVLQCVAMCRNVLMCVDMCAVTRDVRAMTHMCHDSYSARRKAYSQGLNKDIHKQVSTACIHADVNPKCAPTHRFYVWLQPALCMAATPRATHLQHTATHCNTLQPTLCMAATSCATHWQHTATHCNTLQHRFNFVCRLCIALV